MTELVLRNRQRIRPVNLALLRRLTRVLLIDFLAVERFELGIHLVAAPRIARLNRQFLDHFGSTDVITFDHSRDSDSSSAHQRGGPSRGLASIDGDGDGAARPPAQLHGEIFICLDDAVRQARQFRTTWQSELVRYLIHGLLHLVGYDDLTRTGRRAMKREENRWLRLLSREFSFEHLEKAPSHRPANRQS
jgi:probable rRNA maturation factor